MFLVGIEHGGFWGVRTYSTEQLSAERYGRFQGLGTRASRLHSGTVTRPVSFVNIGFFYLSFTLILSSYPSCQTENSIAFLGALLTQMQAEGLSSVLHAL